MSNRYFDNPLPASTSQMRRLQTHLDVAGNQIRVQIIRDRDAYGYSPAVMRVLLDNEKGEAADTFDTAWNMELDDWLIKAEARAETPTEEPARFSLRIQASLRRLWSDWGDAYFNAILRRTLLEGPFSDSKGIRKVAEPIHERAPDEPTTLERIGELEGCLGALARELLQDLHYARETAEVILERALEDYLDERFRVRERSWMLKGVHLSSPRRTAALALADSLERLLMAKTGQSPSSYFYSSVGNIENGDDLSVPPNWEVIVKQVGDALPDGFAPAEVRDDLKYIVERKLASHPTQVIAQACRMLPDIMGGDAETYLQMWGSGHIFGKDPSAG